MTFKYRCTSFEPVAFVTIGKNVRLGEILESEVPLNHPYLELVEDTPKIETPQSVKEPVAPDKVPSPVAVDESKEN